MLITGVPFVSSSLLCWQWYVYMFSVAQSCLTLCDPMDCSPPISSVLGIFQARILKWVAISHSMDLPNPGIRPMSLVSPVLAGRFFTTALPGKPNNVSLIQVFRSLVTDESVSF